jgi:hypothetical protein
MLQEPCESALHLSLMLDAYWTREGVKWLSQRFG